MQNESIKEEIGVSSIGSKMYTPIEYVYDEKVKFMVLIFGSNL